MKYFYSMTMLAGLICCSAVTSNGQEMGLQKPGPEFDVFKTDLGTWDVEIKTWGGTSEPTVTKGRETNRMLGGFWFLTDFQGKMMGMEFKGHGIYSYDREKKQYVGTWIDSMTPRKMDMVGKYDKDSKTMTYKGMAPAPSGKLAKHILKTKYNDDGTHVMTMHVQVDEDMIKIFEMNYTKAKLASR